MSFWVQHPLVAVGLSLLLAVPGLGLVVTFGGYSGIYPEENITPATAVVGEPSQPDHADWTAVRSTPS